jgi:hypothetical protein
LAYLPSTPSTDARFFTVYPFDTPIPLTQNEDLVHISPEPAPAGLDPKSNKRVPFMTLTKEAIKCSVFDRLDLSKTASAKAIEATFAIIKKSL